MKRFRYAAFGAVALLAGTLLLIVPSGEIRATPKPTLQPAGALPADLALVPADAVGFFHIKAADLWKGESFAPFRDVIAKAGPKASAALDSQFVPKPSSFDRVTGFVTLAGNEPKVFGVLSFNAPFNAEQLVAVYIPKAEKKQANGKDVYIEKNLEIAVTFPDDKHILVGMPGALEDYLAKPVSKTGALAGAIQLAAGARPVVAAANVAGLPIPKDAFEQVPPPVRPILAAQQVVVSFDAESKIELKVTYKDEKAAGDANEAIRLLAEEGRKELAKSKKEFEDKLFNPGIRVPRPPQEFPEALGALFGLGAMNWIDELLADQSLVKRVGADLTIGVTLPKQIAAAGGASVAVAVGLLLPAVQKVREAAARTQSANNMKQLMLAIHNYEAAYGHLPADIMDKNGKAILSWRVAILPFIEQDNLYKQFKLDEPWDSPNNKKWSQMMIKVFASPASTKVGPGLTNYVGVSGPGAAFESGKKLRFADFTDGTSNTIMLVETNDAVEWAKPGDLPFDPKKPLPKITPLHANGFNVGMCDGSVRYIVMTVDEKILRAMFTRNGGETVDINK